MVTNSFPCLLCHKLKLTSLIFLTETNIHLLKCYLHFCLPKWHSGKELTWQCRRCRRCGFHPWVGKIPCKKKWQPTPVFLLGKSHGQRSLVGHSPWGCKELDTTEHAHTQYFQSGKDFPLSLERLKATYVAFKNKGGTTIYTWSQKIGGWGPEFAFLTIIFWDPYAYGYLSTRTLNSLHLKHPYTFFKQSTEDTWSPVNFSISSFHHICISV